MGMKIISGAQTGVDRAALDVALSLGLPQGGWCPKGRRAEDGTIDVRYHLMETVTAEYPERTLANIRDSDGTLILVTKPLNEISDGTRTTYVAAEEQQKPRYLVNLLANPEVATVLAWIETNSIKTLNIAGPRESQSPGIYQQAVEYLTTLLSKLMV